MGEIVGSVESLEDCTPACTDTEESTTFPLKCWQYICLSDVWIPSSLLSRNKPPNFLKLKNPTFHTLRKRDSSKRIEGFSVYTDSDGDKEEEIFESDSDSDLLLNCETDYESKINIEQLSENFLSRDSAISSPLNETHNNAEENTKSYYDKDTVKSSLSSLIDETSNPSLLTEMCNFFEKKEKECNLGNVENSCDNSQKLNADIFKSFFCDNAMTDKDTFDLAENRNVKGMVENTVVDKLFLNATKEELPLRENILSFCDRFHDIKSQTTKDSDNLCVSKFENATVSEVSKNEIFNTCLKFTIGDSQSNIKNDPHLKNKTEKKSALHLKRNNKRERQIKKKASKCIPLGEFREDKPYYEADYDDFYYHVLEQSNLSDNLALKNNFDFPELVSTASELMKSDTKKESNVGLKSCVNIISESLETTKNDTVNYCDEKVPSTNENEVIFGKFAIENIPLDTTKDDICMILSGYGEIKEFTLKTAGKFLKAKVQMDLICDIDWIIECLNGSEPFGASSAALICYKED